MTLPTLSKLSVAPPLSDAVFRPVSTDSAQEQSEAARNSIAMAPITTWNHLHVRGVRAQALLAGEYNTSEMTTGSVLTVSDGILARLRRDEFVLLTPDLKPAMDRLASKPAEGLITLTDITHGRAVMHLHGVHAPDVLSKVCALDFADAKFPNRHAAQTSLAKVRTLIIRMDTGPTPTYLLIVDRSLAAYVWDVLYDAAQEWDGIVQRQDSLDLTRR